MGLILGMKYIDHRRYYKVNGQLVSYRDALKHCELPTLAERREVLTSKFALDTFKSGIHTNFFEEASSDRPNTRSKPKVIEPSGSTSKLRKSAMVHLSKKVNKNQN